MSAFRQFLRPVRRFASAAPTQDISGLKAAIASKIPSSVAEVKDIRTRFGDKQLGTCSVTQAYGGMRSVKSMTYETSLLDTEEGIRFRGYTLPDCQQLLPKAPGGVGTEPLPEALFWLLLTGEIPTDKQMDLLRAELAARSKLPDDVIAVIDALPTTLHPMSQLSAGVLAMQRQSVMAAEYEKGAHKSVLWEYCYEDVLTVIAQMPELAARIYRRSFHDGKFISGDADNLDMSANYCKMMGFDDPEFHDLMRLYLTIHMDHEGGNVSAHTIKLVGSALSDPYLSLSAGLNGLAGPLHGLANQEVLRWINDLYAKLDGAEPNHDNLTQLCWDTLNGGKVIPGFGHAVLRKTDPRYTCQREFALKYLPNDKMFKLVSMLYDVVPKVLSEQGKVKNPWPNVDAHSGVLLRYYGMTEERYYTVLFGVSRAMGPLANLVWDRALGLPIERPKSVTTDWIRNHFESEETKAASA